MVIRRLAAWGFEIALKLALKFSNHLVDTLPPDSPMNACMAAADLFEELSQTMRRNGGKFMKWHD